ncbi:MAG: DUF362 domain-containing protein [Pirellulales bacterium]|nr:DUF362 domain-containing protein [Pirellulales bacterium]
MSGKPVSRRRFVETAAAAAGWCLGTSQTPGQGLAAETAAPAQAVVPNAPIGVARGIHPGRVVWAHEPAATRWQGPGNGHWWQGDHTDQSLVDRMLSQSLCRLVGVDSTADAWDRLLRHFNQARGKGHVGYRPGEKIAVKVNFVGFLWRLDGVNPENYNLERRRDYMNTSPQMMRAVLRQLVQAVGAKQGDIALVDTLAHFPNEYHQILHAEFPQVQYVDFAGRFGRVAAKPSSVPLYWSCRPEGSRQDYVPGCFAEADYLINLANLKAHTGAGVTLCAKNHYGSLVRWPAEEGYYDLHATGFAPGAGKYRNLVDLMGHAHLGGKTLVYLIDGLYAGRHPIDPAPLKWNSAPFDGHWSSSLLASQDPVAIDSVALDFLRAEWDDYPHRPGTEDYLHEAAEADSPASGTFYDPDHASGVRRLASLGVHEHWNDAREKQYSRNLETAEGIELVAVRRA